MNVSPKIGVLDMTVSEKKSGVVARRAPNLTDDSIRQIIDLLDGWTGTLTWELLIDAIAERRFTAYTRQALHKHERIRLAFAQCKKRISEGRGEETRRVESPELQAALERIERLQVVNDRLQSENQRLLEQFATWAYNAHSRGLDNSFLSQPMPPIDRETSKRSKRG